MSIFKELRERQGWTKYQAAKKLGLMQNEYTRLEEGSTGERYLKLLIEMCKATGTKWSEVKKLAKTTNTKTLE